MTVCAQLVCCFLVALNFYNTLKDVSKQIRRIALCYLQFNELEGVYKNTGRNLPAMSRLAAANKKQDPLDAGPVKYGEKLKRRKEATTH
jgi:hypothetical protein